MDDVIAIALALAALVSITASRHTIRIAWAPGTRWRALAAQALVSGGMLSQTTVIANPQLARTGTLAAFAVFSALAILNSTAESGRSPGRRYRTATVSILCLWMWLFLVNVAFMFEEQPTTVIARIVSGVILALFLALQHRSPITPHQFYSAAITSIGAVMVSLPLLPTAFRSCTEFKCSELDAILTGPFSSGNYLGLTLAIAAALTMVTVEGARRKIIILGFLLAGLYASAARTSLIAVGAGLTVYTVAYLGRRITRNGGRLVGAAVLSMGATLVVTATATALLLTATPTTLSNRGRVWMMGMSAMSEHPVTGIGLDSWSHLQATGEVSYHFTHSEFLLIIFAGGAVGLGLFAVVIARTAYLGAHRSGAIAGGLVVPLTFAVCGIAEVVWNPLTIDGLTWLFFAAVAVGTAETQNHRPRTTDRVDTLSSSRNGQPSIEPIQHA